jgi:GTP-binding protein
MFCDEHKFRIKAGSGGNGCVSFRREKFVPNGGPDGGDGGNGGDVIIKVNPQLNTLSHMVHKRLFKAKTGVPGKGKKMHGKNAETLVIEVPRGTIIFNSDKTEKIADLDLKDSSYVIAKGGKGGLGNARFATSTNQIPRFAESGEPGEEVEVTLELKLVAEVGIIGLPSAGKSTLISVISNARPKIAAYHFTTLNPNLGVVNMKEFGLSNKETFVVADIPGLIEGASEGKGLGHQFLKHIQRTKILVHMLDATEENLEENYKTIKEELHKFDASLSDKPEIIVLNKADLLDEESLEEKKKAIKKVSKKEVYLISAAARTNLEALMQELYKEVQKLRLEKTVDDAEIQTEGLPVFRPHIRQRQFEVKDPVEVENENGEKYKLYEVTGKRIEQVAIMTDHHHREGLERIYYFLNRIGIQKVLQRKGIGFGDRIKIGEKVIPYRK